MNMTARFKAYRDLNREIDLQIERLEQMEAKAGSPSTPNLSGMPKGSSFQHDRIADTVARIADLRSEIDSLIAERAQSRKPLKPLSGDCRMLTGGLCCGCAISIQRTGKTCFSLHTEESRISMKNTTTTSSGYSATTSKR